MKKGSSKYDKKVIELLKKHPKGLKRQEIQKNTKIPQSRLTESLKRLTNQSKIRPVGFWDNKKRISVKDRYYLTALEGLANPDKLTEIIELYKKAKKDNNKPLLIELQREIEDIVLNLKVRDKTFINFIIQEAIKINQDTHILRKCLGHLVTNLRMAIETNSNTMDYVFNYDEKHLIELIESSQNQLEKIIFNNKRLYIERLEIFDTIRKFTKLGIIEIAFKLLPQLDTKEKIYSKKEFEKLRTGYSSSYSFSESKEKLTEFQIFENDIENVIFLYADLNLDDCKTRLWELLTADANKIMANKIQNLLEKIRVKSHKKEIEYSSKTTSSIPFTIGRLGTQLGITSLSPGEISEVKQLLRERRANKYSSPFSSVISKKYLPQLEDSLSRLGSKRKNIFEK